MEHTLKIELRRFRDDDGNYVYGSVVQPIKDTLSIERVLTTGLHRTICGDGEHIEGALRDLLARINTLDVLVDSWQDKVIAYHYVVGIHSLWKSVTDFVEQFYDRKPFPKEEEWLDDGCYQVVYYAMRLQYGRECLVRLTPEEWDELDNE